MAPAGQTQVQLSVAAIEEVDESGEHASNVDGMSGSGVMGNENFEAMGNENYGQLEDDANMELIDVEDVDNEGFSGVSWVWVIMIESRSSTCGDDERVDLYDSGASKHVSPFRDQFTTYSAPKNPSNVLDLLIVLQLSHEPECLLACI